MYGQTVTKQFSISEVMEIHYEFINWNDKAHLSPTIVYLHSAGYKYKQKDLQNSIPLITFGNSILDDFNIIIPSCPNNSYWSDKYVYSCISDAINKYTLNKRQIYGTGHSMGARGLWWTATQYPNLFTAIAPIAGYSYYLAAEQIKHLPCWAFHSLDDDVVPFIESKKMIQALIDCKNPNARLTSFKNSGHGCSIDTIYRQPYLFEWFLKFCK